MSWTVIYCVFLWTKLFSVKLKPKGFFFSCLLSHFCFTLTENICCMLPLIPIYCWNICLLFQHDTWLSVLEVCLWKPHKLEWYWQEVYGWVICRLSVCYIVFFLFSYYYYYYCYYHVLSSHREVWNVQYRILQSMQAKNCGTLFSVYGICKCTGRNYLYFSNVISLIWGKTVLQLPESHKQCKWEFDFYFLILYGWHMLSGILMPDINGPQIWLSVGIGIQIDHLGLLYCC